jgi:glycosyltransferase involved in cell wall biosynthesis
MKKVHHLSFSLSGGAGSVAKRISSFQNQLDGYESQFDSIIDKDLKSNPLKNTKVTLEAAVDQYIIKKNFFLPLFSLLRERSSLVPNSPIFDDNSNLHLHWTSGMISPNILAAISRKVPMIIWTMHDFAPLTGGCHFPLECENYLRNCSNCPAVRGIFQNKVEILKAQKNLNLENIQNLKIVFPSKWMQNKFNKMNIKTKLPTSVIYNPISDIFYQEGILGWRSKLGIGENSFVIGFVSSQIDNPLKRIGEYMNIIKRVSNQTDRNIVAIIVGNGKLKFTDAGTAKVLRVENIDNEKQMVALYNTFDLLLSTSLSETFGLAIAEAIATGTKAIVYQNSTADELIDDKNNGYIVNCSDQAVKVILQEIQFSKSIKRNFIKSSGQFRIETICSKYDKLYINES